MQQNTTSPKKIYSVQSIRSLITNTLHIIKIVWRFDPHYFILRLIFEFVWVIFPIAIAALSATFINRLTAFEFSSITDPNILGILILYITLPLISEVSSLFDSLISNRFFIFFDQYVQMLYTEKVGEVDLQTHEDSDFQNLFQKTKETYYKLTGATENILYFIQYGFTALITLIILTSQAWWIGCLLIIGFIPDLIVQLTFGKRKWGIWDAQTGVKRKFWEISGYFNHLESIKEMKVFQTGKRFITTLREILTSFNTETWNNEKKRFFWSTLGSLISYSVLTFITIYFVSNVIDKAIAIGTFLFLIGRVTDLRSSLNSTFKTYATLNSENLYISDIFKFLNTEHILSNGTVKLPEKHTPAITFDSVTFKYPKTKTTIFNNLSFTIHPGEKIAIVGVNGAGKTTLVKLIMRLYDPTKGRALLDTIPLNKFDIINYYNQIGFLSQDYAKYRLPLLEAIALGDITTPIDRRKVIEACKKAGADEFIRAWKDGYDSHLGKEFDGVEPSVGQWQKLALARLFYKNPRIWILDEPTSSIDAIAEMQIFDELGNLPNDRTVILISHRFNTVKNADRIMVIEHGSIVEFDNHENLMKKKDGHYKKLFEAQKESYE